ncbi:hypothetical protein AQUCO_00100849v1 [Aquilegia coerulea]|uniref:Helitron helicase-like domain-containing protein n=1 Tax=Aquilegia coerulea TaxID=218851 RepID=A0A2G5FCF3_AQUCA|nr:hypothetical protein AQUCO_00100849v1 [Aquilegia coerulea]
MDVECSFCHALHWDGEKLSKPTRKKTLFGMCCLQGKIKLPPLSPLPPSIQSLYEGSDKNSKSFSNNIRAYNASNAFTSLGVKMDDRILNGRGPKAFTIHGELCHNVGSLIPEIRKVPSYAQLYIYDSNSATDYRNKRNPQLLENNKLCKVYKHAYEVLKESNTDEDANISVWLHYKPDTDKKRYNLPTSEDIAVIMPGDGTEIASKRDIVLHLRGNKLKRISDCHPSYLPLHYVLLFPNGDLGWSTSYLQWDVKRNCHLTKRLTQLESFRYRIFERSTEYSSIIRGGSLFQEFLVDAWAAYEQNRLSYTRNHQDDLRAEVYSGLTVEYGLTDIVDNGNDPKKIG